MSFLREITTSRQAKNGTQMFCDSQTGFRYTSTKHGYVRELKSNRLNIWETHYGDTRWQIINERIMKQSLWNANRKFKDVKLIHDQEERKARIESWILKNRR